MFSDYKIKTMSDLKSRNAAKAATAASLETKKYDGEIIENLSMNDFKHENGGFEIKFLFNKTTGKYFMSCKGKSVGAIAQSADLEAVQSNQVIVIRDTATGVEVNVMCKKGVNSVEEVGSY